MSLRIAEPLPLRTLGLGTAIGGVLTMIFAGFNSPAALVGVVALCAGIALPDAVDRGGMQRRQVGLFLLTPGGGVGAWALVVTLLLAILRLPADPAALALLAGSVLAVGGAVDLFRYAPRAAETSGAGGTPGHVAGHRIRVGWRTTRRGACSRFRTPSRLFGSC